MIHSDRLLVRTGLENGWYGCFVGPDMVLFALKPVSMALVSSHAIIRWTNQTPACLGYCLTDCGVTTGGQ